MNKKTVAIIGNPNSGKTTLFNVLTGSNQKTGNWSGVTVDKVEGYFSTKNYNVTLVDLPGLWGFYSDSEDEILAKRYLIENSPDCILIIIDGTMLERSLMLVLSLLDRKIPILLAINMADELESYGITINTDKLEEFLPIKTVTISALKELGIDSLLENLDSILSSSDKEKNERVENSELLNSTLLENKGKEINLIPPGMQIYIDDLFQKLEEFLPEFDRKILYFSSVLLLCLDNLVYDLLPLNNEQKLYLSAMVKEYAANIIRKYKQDPANYLIDYRYSKAKALANEIAKHKETNKTRFVLSDALDRIVISKFGGLLIFLLIMFLIFQLTFTISQPLSDLIEKLFDLLSNSVENFLLEIGSRDFLISLLINGIIPPIASVAAFIPSVGILFFFISFLEDSGYMARASFMSDKIMHIAGLHGKSFIPMILGFGCNVPAIMATRTLETPKDRIITILMNPLMSCSARLPVYLLFAQVFFPKNASIVVFSLYLLGVILSLLVGKIFKFIYFKNDDATLLIDLPPYRAPSLKNAFTVMSLKVWDFLKRIIVYVLTGSIILWFLSYFPTGKAYGSEESIIGSLAKVFTPILKPLGFGYWQVFVALIFGFIGKELVIASLASLLTSTTGESLALALPLYFNPTSAYAFLVFVLLYIPCLATVAVIRKEAGKKWMWIAIFYQTILAYAVSFGFYKLLSVLI